MIPWKKVAAVPENLQKRSQLGGCVAEDEQRQEREKDPEAKRNRGLQEEVLEKDRKLQEAELAIKDKFGKNAILKGMNFKAEATTRERNMQIGGHKSGETGGRKDGQKR